MPSNHSRYRKWRFSLSVKSSNPSRTSTISVSPRSPFLSLALFEARHRPQYAKANNIMATYAPSSPLIAVGYRGLSPSRNRCGPAMFPAQYMAKNTPRTTDRLVCPAMCTPGRVQQSMIGCASVSKKPTMIWTCDLRSQERSATTPSQSEHTGA